MENISAMQIKELDKYYTSPNNLIDLFEASHSAATRYPRNISSYLRILRWKTA
jgi:hypothetical protein